MELYEGSVLKICIWALYQELSGLFDTKAQHQLEFDGENGIIGTSKGHGQLVAENVLGLRMCKLVSRQWPSFDFGAPV